MIHTIGNSAFTFAGQLPAGNLTPAVEAKSLSAWQRAWAAGGDLSSGDSSRIGSPLEQSEWTLACVRMLANPLCSVPLAWWDSADTTEREPLAPDAERADFWHSPTMDDFGAVALDNAVFALAAWLSLEGEAYIILPDEWLGRRSRNLPPVVIAGRGEMNPQFAARRSGLARELLGYSFSASGVNALLIPEQVVRLSFLNPHSRERGLGAWSAAQVSANADRAASIYSRNIAASNGAQSDYIVTDGGMPSKEQQEQIEFALREKKRRAANGDFSPVFLAAGLKVQSPADRAVGAALAAQREGNRESIAAAFGIPLSMLQKVSGSSLGEGRVDSEMRALIANACAPIARRIASGFSVVEQRRTRSRAFCEFDLDDHPAMRGARLALAETAKTFVDMGIPLAEVNRNLGLGFEIEESGSNEVTESGEDPDKSGQDKVATELAEASKLLRAYCAKQLVVAPKGGDGDGTNREASGVGALHSSPSHNNQLTIVVKAEGNTTQPSPDPAMPGPAQALAAGDGAPSPAKPRDKARLAKWQDYQRKRKPFEARIKSTVAAIYKSATAEALASLAANLPAATTALEAAMPAKALVGMETKALSFAAIAVDALGSALGSAILPIISEAYAAGTEEAASELRALGIDPRTPPEVGAFLRVRENFIKDAGKTTFDKLTASLNAGFDQGETMSELAGRVKQVMRSATDEQAVTIAVTETHTAFSTARQAQQEAAGVAYKEWLSAGDDRVRFTHSQIDGIVMPSDQPFAVGGALLMHPCAEGGPAEEVINCRCIAIAVSEEEGAAKFAAQTPQL